MKYYEVKMKIELIRHVEARTKAEAERIASDKGEVDAMWDYPSGWKAQVTDLRPGDYCYWAD